MNFKIVKLILISSLIITWASTSSVFAAVESSLQKTLTIDGVPVDVVVSQDGNRTFVLIDGGNVAIYDRFGNLTDTIKVGPHVDQIEIDPRGERLFATSRQNKTVEIIALDFIHQINTLGSPSKGPLEAPIVIAVFSDFQ
jgi:DNA-binding beta-propeller fold protein YncE